MSGGLPASAKPAPQQTYTYSPAPWLAHDMTPKDPYNYPRHQGRVVGRSTMVCKRLILHIVFLFRFWTYIVRVNCLARQVGSTEQVLGGAKVSGTSEIGTGMQSNLYKPSFGEPQRSFRRKGYFRNPDLAEPRKRTVIVLPLVWLI